MSIKTPTDCHLERLNPTHPLPAKKVYPHTFIQTQEIDHPRFKVNHGLSQNEAMVMATHPAMLKL